MLLSSVQKRALFKLAVDLAKADKQIHGNEVALLSSLQEELNVSNEDLEETSYTSDLNVKSLANNKVSNTTNSVNTKKKVNKRATKRCAVESLTIPVTRIQKALSGCKTSPIT